MSRGFAESVIEHTALTWVVGVKDAEPYEGIYL